MSAPRLNRLDRNLLINGNFDFWQRGVGPTQLSAQSYVADRWLHTETLATGAATIERSTDVPNGESSYSAKLTVTASQASPAAGELSIFQQAIEGSFFRPARGQNLTLSFYIKTSVTGTWFLSLRNGGVTRSLLKPFTVSVANTWTKILINFTHDETGTWLYDSGAGLRVALTLAAGTNWHSTSANVWENGQFYATAGGVNFFAVNSSTLFISQIKLQIGEASEATFSTAGTDYASELRLCQRYFEKSYDDGVSPGTSTNTGLVYGGWTANGSFGSVPMPFKVAKRATPAVVFRDAVANLNAVSFFNASNLNQVNNHTVQSSTVNQSSATAFFSNTSGAAGIFAGHFTADAEL